MQAYMHTYEDFGNYVYLYAFGISRFLAYRNFLTETKTNGTLDSYYVYSSFEAFKY